MRMNSARRLKFTTYCHAVIDTYPAPAWDPRRWLSGPRTALKKTCRSKF